MRDLAMQIKCTLVNTQFRKSSVEAFQTSAIDLDNHIDFEQLI
jgi:hypothetical protein